MRQFETRGLIVGLGHYRRTGKDTFANMFCGDCKSLGVVVAGRSFARKLKETCFELYGWAGMRRPEFYETPFGATFRDRVLPAIGKSPRQIWIDFGTHAVREQVYERTWVDYVLQSAAESIDPTVITDVRFPNEAEAIHDMGGVLLKVVRPGYGPGPDAADRALLGYDGWDYVIGGGVRCGDEENPSLADLAYWSKKFASWVAGQGPQPYQTEEDRAANLAVEETQATHSATSTKS